MCVFSAVRLKPPGTGLGSGRTGVKLVNEYTPPADVLVDTDSMTRSVLSTRRASTFSPALAATPFTVTKPETRPGVGEMKYERVAVSVSLRSMSSAVRASRPATDPSHAEAEIVAPAVLIATKHRS